MVDVIVRQGGVNVRVGSANDQTVRVKPSGTVGVVTGSGSQTTVVQDTTVNEVTPGTPGPRVIEVGKRGPAGPPGPSGGEAVVRVAGHTLGGHRLVRIQADGTVAYVDNTNVLHGDDTFGVTLDAADAGDNVNIQTDGAINEPSWAWVPGEPIFASTNGLLTQLPPDAAFSQVVGFAATPTSMVVAIQTAVYN